MIQKISMPVSVALNFDHERRKAFPKWIVWEKKLYPISKIGLHHTYRKGHTLFHVFSVATKTMFFRLVLNTETLHWKLEEISDGLPD